MRYVLSAGHMHHGHRVHGQTQLTDSMLLLSYNTSTHSFDIALVPAEPSAGCHRFAKGQIGKPEGPKRVLKLLPLSLQRTLPLISLKCFINSQILAN